jgi:hypothetical protein
MGATTVRRRLAALLALGALVATVAGCSDPGDGGGSQESLAGPDADGNGVRDDVETVIAGLTSDSVLSAYLSEVARTTQLVVVLDTDAPGAAEEAYRLASRTNLLVSCPPDGLDLDEAMALLEEVQGAVADTPGRRSKLDELSELISGRSFTEPDCDRSAPTWPTGPSR